MLPTEVNGAGTQIWAQGDGTYGNGSGLINQDIDLPPGNLLCKTVMTNIQMVGIVHLSLLQPMVLSSVTMEGFSPSDPSTVDASGAWENTRC